MSGITAVSAHGVSTAATPAATVPTAASSVTTTATVCRHCVGGDGERCRDREHQRKFAYHGISSKDQSSLK
jgi:hypothetical protein